MIKTVLANLTSRARLEVAMQKVAYRFLEPRVDESARRWATAESVDWLPAARRVDRELYLAALEFGTRLEGEARATLAKQATPFGGGGAYVLLYFLVRLTRPSVVVETGVAAGWSSRAILEALETNGMGELWSSDFPYITTEHPERSIGCLVPEELRHRWHLLLDGDRHNLPAILERCGPVDLFHYDSDKSLRGRAWALGTVDPHLRRSAVVVMDDIEDNLFFAEFVREGGWDFAVIPKTGNYFVGVAGRGTIPWLESAGER
jgi:predicted O-methyltransferase YrrM